MRLRLLATRLNESREVSASGRASRSSNERKTTMSTTRPCNTCGTTIDITRDKSVVDVCGPGWTCWNCLTDGEDETIETEEK